MPATDEVSDPECTADYVIVGAGSAGCVLANRLSENPGTRVILIEAGGDDRPLHEVGQFWSNVMIQLPIGFARTVLDPKVNWLYRTEPDHLGRQIDWPRGKVLGGSSSINGLLYVRGQHADYDDWRAQGCTGWGWQDVDPYFRRAEDFAGGADAWHGAGGPLHVSRTVDRHPLSDAVLGACVEAGLPLRDTNGADQEGADYFQLTIRNGRRCSAAVAYLHPVLHRRNLRVIKHALAERVQIVDGKATGVVIRRHGERQRVTARREVLIAAGAVNSPQLLQLSGIGDGGSLRELGIDTLLHRPEVGQNLQDHYILMGQYRLRSDAPSINHRTRGLALAAEVVKYAVSRCGLLAMPSSHVGVFCRSRADLDRPDIQFHILPGSRDAVRTRQLGKYVMEHGPGLTIAPCQLRPESRGSIAIKSADAADYPSIAPNYLSAERDQQVAIASLRWMRRLAHQPSLAKYIERELVPGGDVENDAALLEFARREGRSVYHPVGTCRMGDDDRAVVAPDLRVREIEGLRVVDASVMPTLVSGNTNAAAIMIGEKGADLIRGA